MNFAKAGCIAIALGLPATAQPAQVFTTWAPKPVAPEGWKSPNKPVWRLSEILIAHQGQKHWSQAIVRDKDYAADYIQMAPGEKTRPLMYADDRTFFVVWGGQIRFTIQGQQPFVASKGFLVQVPFRTVYSMETVGDAPSLRFEVRRAGVDPYYAIAEGDTAPQRKGIVYTKVSYRLLPDPYGGVNQPYVDFFKDWVNNPANKGGGKPFVSDDHNRANISRGMGRPTPPDSDKGHFHTNMAEFWFVPEGRIDFLLEGRKLLTAGEGDVVYAPPGRWHRASFAPGQMDTRISIHARPKSMQNYALDAGDSQ